MLSFIISENNMPQPCLSLVVPPPTHPPTHAEASLKSTLHKKTPQKRNLDLRRKLDEVYISKGQCGKANIKPC